MTNNRPIRNHIFINNINTKRNYENEQTKRKEAKSNVPLTLPLRLEG